MPAIMLSVQETAERLGVSEQTVMRMIAAGTLPAYRIGRRWRIDQTDLETYIASTRYDPKGSTDEPA
jgi:putative molybdopterin biosynthesis protein